jgi:hypothetical protein
MGRMQMFDRTIAIEIVSREPFTFRFVGPDRQDPKFVMMAISDVATEETLWWICFGT